MIISKSRKVWIAAFALLVLVFFAVRSDFVQYSLIPIVYPKYGAVHYVNPDIPPDFQFTNWEEEIPEEFRLKPASISMSEGLGSHYYCNVNLPGHIAEEVEYYRFNPGYGATGGSSRSAYVCGNEYIISSYDGSGPGVYGPFKLDRITSESNLYSIEIPKDWRITANDAWTSPIDTAGSSLIAESPDWKMREDPAPESPCNVYYYESGASLEISASQGELEGFDHSGEGGIDPNAVTEEKEILIDGVKGVYHVFKDNCSTYEGQQLDVHLNLDGTYYEFELKYNQVKYPNGEAVFMDILNSVKFTR